MRIPEPLNRLTALLAKLPGVGRRSAERMAYALLADQGLLLRELGAAVQEAGQQLRLCSRCGAVTTREDDPCSLCNDPRRATGLLCVVEQPYDIAAMERAGGFGGRYHALMGRISPAKGEGIGQLRIEALLARVQAEQISELILALNADVESDATAAFLREALAGRNVRISRPARGMPTGAGLAHADSETLSRAMQYRQPF